MNHHDYVSYCYRSGRELAAAVHGDLILPADPGYDQARTI